VAALVDGEIAKLKETGAAARSEREHFTSRLDVMTETMSQLEEEAKEMRRQTDAHLAAISKMSGSAEDNFRRIESFVEDFTLQESANIRDEVLKLLNSDTAVAQRKIDDRHRRDELAAVKQDMLRNVTALERLQEEVGRVTTQQHTLYQAFQRSEHSLTSVQHKVDTEMRTELQRLEQSQKSFFARQDQSLASDRHNMLMKLQEEMRRLQERHIEEIKGSEQRRLDDVHQAQQQVRDDFAAFVDQQRKDQQMTVAKLKEDFVLASRQAHDEMHRSLGTLSDVNKRQHALAMDEFRKTTTRTQDDLRRLHATVDEVSQRLNEQSSHLQNRVQHLMDEEVLRIERMGNEIALQLNAVVEEEVKRVIKGNDGATQRAIAQLDERSTRELKTLRDETISLRTTLNAIAAPSTSIQAVDARVDVLRKDMGELYDIVGQVRQLEQRLAARTREEARAAVEAVRVDMARDVATQLHRFDAVLVDLGREQAVRSEEVASLAMKFDRASSAILASQHQQPQQQSQPQPQYQQQHQSMSNTFVPLRSASTQSALLAGNAAQPHDSRFGARAGTGNSIGFAATPPSGSRFMTARDGDPARSDADRALDSLLASPIETTRLQRSSATQAAASMQSQPQQNTHVHPRVHQLPPQRSGSLHGVNLVLPSSTPASPSAAPSRASDVLRGAFDG
jgi:hypothetical protein